LHSSGIVALNSYIRRDLPAPASPTAATICPALACSSAPAIAPIRCFFLADKFSLLGGIKVREFVFHVCLRLNEFAGMACSPGRDAEGLHTSIASRKHLYVRRLSRSFLPRRAPEKETRSGGERLRWLLPPPFVDQQQYGRQLAGRQPRFLQDQLQHCRRHRLREFVPDTARRRLAIFRVPKVASCEGY
jgi:hypothetical protein